MHVEIWPLHHDNRIVIPPTSHKWLSHNLLVDVRKTYINQIANIRDVLASHWRSPGHWSPTGFQRECNSLPERIPFSGGKKMWIGKLCTIYENGSVTVSADVLPTGADDLGQKYKLTSSHVRNGTCGNYAHCREILGQEYRLQRSEEPRSCRHNHRWR